MREINSILKEVFGDSSESDSENESNPNQRPSGGSNDDDPFRSTFRRTLTWDPVKDINGLWICRDFLSPEQQSFLLLAIQNEGWFIEASHNQAMRFGDLPAWASELSNSICETILFSEHVTDFSECTTSGDNIGDACIIFPPNLIWREPLFNQLIANVYQPGEGISAHVDLMRFDDGIAIISLESSCIMHFTKVKDQFEEEEQKGSKKHPVYLNPGSLVLMWGEARYHWTHEINRKPGFQELDGKEIEQRRRTSITLRKLLCQFE